MHAHGRYRVCLLIIFSKRGIGGGLRPASDSLLLLPRVIRNVSICKTASYTRSSVAVSPKGYRVSKPVNARGWRYLR
jgi:hypothetical protein